MSNKFDILGEKNNATFKAEIRKSHYIEGWVLDWTRQKGCLQAVENKSLILGVKVQLEVGKIAHNHSLHNK